MASPYPGSRACLAVNKLDFYQLCGNLPGRVVHKEHLRAPIQRLLTRKQRQVNFLLDARSSQRREDKATVVLEVANQQHSNEKCVVEIASHACVSAARVRQNPD